MAKETKPKEEPRRVGPKFARSTVIPQHFQIRRPSSPMADLLDAAVEATPNENKQNGKSNLTPVEFTPVNSTPVKSPGVVSVVQNIQAAEARTLPPLEEFVDRILPRFPPARQAILIRLYRWAEGTEKDLVVSTPRLAAITNMDEKSCRSHLHALIADGFLTRAMDGEQIARFGGSDRGSRGLILRISIKSIAELLV